MIFIASVFTKFTLAQYSFFRLFLPHYAYRWQTLDNEGKNVLRRKL